MLAQHKKDKKHFIESYKKKGQTWACDKFFNKNDMEKYLQTSH